MSHPALRFQLEFTYEDQTEPVLKDVSGTVEKGQCIVLCGSSGCGKSTLLRCINHLIPQFYEGDLKGCCFLNGQDQGDLSIGEVGRLAASVFQDPRSQFFTLNSSTEVAFGLENFGFTQSQMREKVKNAFTSFSLDDLQNRDVFKLSSGQRQLVAILSAWALDTDLFLLDEPTANLDFEATQQLKKALDLLKAQGKTMVISEHRLSYLSGLADEYWVMDQGRILKKLKREEMLTLSLEELQALGLRVTDLRQISDKSFSLPPKISVKDTLSAENISLQYGANPVLKGLNFTAETGEVVGIIGANGCGKSTFGKAAAGLLKPTAGTFLLNGENLSSKALSARSMFIMQEAEFQFFTNSVLNELSYGLSNWEEKQQEAQALLKLSGLWELRNRHPFSLSGGQMQKLVLLMACLSDNPIIILDEPTAGLDYKSLQICAQLIKSMQKNRIVLVITHDLELIHLVCTRWVQIFGGKVSQDVSLSGAHGFQRLRAAMEAPAVQKSAFSPVGCKPHVGLDPRTKLLIVLIAMAAGIYTDLHLIFFAFLSVAAAALCERRWSLIAGGLGLMGTIIGAYLVHPTVGFSFLAHFFPRIILMATGALLIISPEEAPRTLAALRKLRVPEKAIMVFSIIFRFFPVLSGDLKIMHSSMRTRGFFVTLKDKLAAIPQYLEMVLVPMVFRVLRIAETLSASAETRGIALPGKRESYISLQFHFTDVIIAALTLIFTALGLLL